MFFATYPHLWTEAWTSCSESPLPVVHRHGKTDTDSRESGNQVLVLCATRQNAHVIEKDDDNTHGHQPEHQGDIPSWGGPLLIDGLRLV